MLEPPRRTRSDDCLSDLRLDRLRVGELEGEALDEARAHLRGCSPCRERLEALTADAEAFAAEAPPIPALRLGRTARRRRTSVLAGLGTLAAAAALVLVIRREGPSDTGEGISDVPPPSTTASAPPGPASGTRPKGGPRIGFVIRRGERMFDGGVDEPVHPGDALRFHYTTTEDAQLAVLSVDGAGTVSVYYPGGPTTAPVLAGREQSLDNSVVLDAVIGPETVFAVFCEKQHAVADLEGALKADPTDPRFPDDCRDDRLTLDKRRARR